MLARLEKLMSRLSDSDFHRWLKNFKPIHLCWLYRRMGWKVPRYLIGSDPANVVQTHFIKGADDSSDPDTCTWGTEDDSTLEHEKEDPFMLRIQIANNGGKDSGVSAWSLWYSTTPVAGGSTQVTTSSNVVRIVDDSGSQITDQTLTDAAVMTATGTRADGYYTDASDATTSVKVANSEYFEHQFCIQFQSDASAEQDYYFYIREAGAAIDDYNNVPVITAKAGNVIVTPTALSISATLNAPTAISDVTISPSALALTAAYPSPSIVCDVTISPSALALTAAYPAPSIIGDVIVSPSALTLTAAYPAPSIVGDVAVSPSALSLTAAYPSPSVVCDVTVSPSAMALTAAVIAPSIIIPESEKGGEPTAFMKPTRGIQLNKTHPLARGLVGCWLMNESGGNTIFDLSGNKTKGALAGDALFSTAKTGSGVLLNSGGAGGDGRITFTNDAPVIADGSKTVSAWIKIDDVVSSYRILLSSGPNATANAPNGDAGFLLFFRYATHKPKFAAFDGTDYAQTDYSPTPALTAGQWYHIVGTWNAQTKYVRIYINGIEITAAAVQNTDVDSIAGTGLFTSSTSTGLEFFGRIDHYVVYNRALSAAEIASLFREPFQMFEREISQALISYVPSSVVSPTALALSATINAPAIVGDVTVNPSALALMAAYPSPSVVGDVTVSPSALSLTAAVNVPTIIGDVTVSPSTLSLTAAYPAPSVVCDVTVSPSALSLTAAYPSPSVVCDVTVSPSVLALTAAVVDPVVDISGNATIYPSAQAITAAIQDPAVIINATVQPTAIGLSASLNSPNIISNTIITPTAFSLSSSQQAPTIVIDAAHNATALNLTGAINAPSLDISVDISPSALALTGQVVAPSFAIGSVFAPSAFDLQATINAPTIIAGEIAMPWLAFFVTRQCAG